MSRELHTIELTLEKIPRVIIHTVISVCALSGHIRSRNWVKMEEQCLAII